MISAGYMYKSVVQGSDGVNNSVIENIYSVSGCTSEDFTDWINYWKHNGYWLFDKPEVIEDIANNHDISLDGMTLFFYRFSDQEWNVEDKCWQHYYPEESFSLDIVEPVSSKVVGYDLVSFSGHVDSECSPLSCNDLAQSVTVNRHCLLDTYQEAEKLLFDGKLDNCEPGPYRIVEVLLV